MFAHLAAQISEQTSHAEGFPTTDLPDNILSFKIILSNQKGEPATTGHTAKDIHVEVRRGEDAEEEVELAPLEGGSSYSLRCELKHGAGVYTVGIKIKGKVLATFPKTVSYKVVRAYYEEKSRTPVATFGSKGNGQGEFDCPYRAGIWVAQGPEGDKTVFVADSSNNRVQIFDGKGSFLASFGSYGEDDGQFDRPSCVLVDSHSNILVGDLSQRVQIFDSNLSFIRLIKCANKCGSISLDESAGRLYVAGEEGSYVEVFDYQTGQQIVPPKCFSGNDFKKNGGLVVDPKRGVVYAAIRDSESANKVGIFDPNFDREIGSFSLRNDRPDRIALDHLGNLIIASVDAKQVRIVDLSDIDNPVGLWDIWVDGAKAVAVAPDGTIYVLTVTEDDTRIEVKIY